MMSLHADSFTPTHSPEHFTVIAIDGPAASGKSSVARLVAQKLGYIFISSGFYYRALAWSAVKQAIDISNPKAIAQWLATLKLETRLDQGEGKIFIDALDVSSYLSDISVNQLVSPLAACADVRAFLLNKLRALSHHQNIVMEGRDIGSIVFPEASYKFYLDASLEERIRRRKKEGTDDFIAKRDQQDSNRTLAPLVIAEGAIVIDTTHCTVEKAAEIVLQNIHS